MIKNRNILIYFIVFFFQYQILSAEQFGKSVEFSFNPSQDTRLSEKVNKVSIAGTFNDWDKNRDIFEADVNGVFKKKIFLQEGEHNYKIVVNDNIWLEDLNADFRLRKDAGMTPKSFNSGILIKETGSEILKK